ncbi:MAG: hypothetical protein RIQ56_655 [Candidatus Parcubacteria bacterium]
MTTRLYGSVSALVLSGIFFLLFPVNSIFAQSKADLQKSIDEHSSQITQLNKEIEEYQKQLEKVSTAKQTLQGALSQINLQIKKVTATVNVTKKQISSTQLEIRQLENGIEGKEVAISRDSAALGSTIRNLHEAERETLAEQILGGESLSDTWQDMDNTAVLQQAVREKIDRLEAQKRELTNTKEQREVKEKELLKQRANLISQQGSLNATKVAQSELLSQTKSQESTFQKIIAEKKRQQASFEDALNDLKSQLQKTVDLSGVAAAGQGVLRWPVDNVRVTQYFGNTAFAASGAYKGKGHNGIDLAAPIGTPLKAAATGLVIGTGNTDSVRGCYSFGKWVMIKHSNGLNTMYAHLSQISVSAGQTVGGGDVIGFSGETGYATGPHLHFGVYVSSATQIMKLGDATKSSTSCANATMPITPISGYLNPMNYLSS